MFALIFTLLAICVSIFLYLYFASTRTFGFWRQLGIACPPPVPFFGNIKDFVFGKKHLTLVYDDVYKSFNKEPYVGIFEISSPNLLIRDPELAHRILVQDFSHFYDRGLHTNEDLDPLSAHLVNLAGQRWKATRSKLMPAFSSGKLKQMYPLMGDCVQELDTYLERHIAENNDRVEMREMMAKFATDVIGRCAFGLNCNTLADPDAEFRKIGRKIFAFTYRIILRIFLRMISPKLLTTIRVKMMPPDVEKFFFNMLYDTVEQRKSISTSGENVSERRTDFLQLMIDIREQEKNSNVDESVAFTDTLFVANMFVFFAGGFETTATALSGCIYELALNEDVQNKLREEIKSALENQPTNDLGHEDINNLKYLDMVISETLRKYVPIPFNARICTKDYQIPETDITLKAGTRVTIPTYSFHMDPQYFPDPEKFQPERFVNINKNCRFYLPFGDGPRICIGLRFARLEMKCCLVSLLLKYSFSTCEQTEIPLPMKARSIFFTPKNGIVLKVSPLSNKTRC